MAKFTWISTSSLNVVLGANWQKDDGTVGTAPSTGDDLYFQGISGSSLAAVWASGGANLAAPAAPTTSGASSTGGFLVQSTHYFYKIAAINTSGEGPVGAELDYTVPASGTSTNQITLNWAAVTGATAYAVYRGTVTGANKYIGTTAGVSFADVIQNPDGPAPGSVTFGSINISLSFTPTIGSAGQNGYWKAPASVYNIGTPIATPGVQGNGRIKIDAGTVSTMITQYNSGNTADAGQPTVRMKNVNSASKIYVLGGTFGLAVNQPGEASTIASINVSGLTAQATLGPLVVWAGGANVSNSATLTTNSGTAGTVDASTSAKINLYGTAEVTTIINTANINHQVRSGGVDTALLTNYPGGFVDFSGNPANVTVTSLVSYPGSSYNPSPANNAHLIITTPSSVNAKSVVFQ